MSLYRNSEKYADPTAGAAFAHIAYEEREARRRAARIKQDKLDRILAEKKKAKELKRKALAKKRREELEKNAHWVLAWPKPTDVVIIKEAGK